MFCCSFYDKYTMLLALGSKKWATLMLESKRKEKTMALTMYICEHNLFEDEDASSSTQGLHIIDNILN